MIWRRSRTEIAAVLGAAAFLCAPSAWAPSAWAQATPGPGKGNDPVAPYPIGDGLYYVGASDIAAYLISTDAGLILIDGGWESTAPQILANLKTLGFDPRQVKILLFTHAHPDHAGGLAALKRATGAQIYASAEDGAQLVSGGKGDFLLGDTFTFPPVKPDKIVADEEKVTLGAVTLTARLTPGHTKGCTTWTFPVKVDGVVRQAMVICGLSLLPGVKLVDVAAYPTIAADFEKSYATWAKLPCEVFLAANSKSFRGAEKRASMKPGAPNPFVDPEGCKTFIAENKARFDIELAKQRLQKEAAQ